MRTCAFLGHTLIIINNNFIIIIIINIIVFIIISTSAVECLERIVFKMIEI